MNAIIYAAGRGIRLGKHAQEHPKVLLEFGGLSLLERHVRCLAQIGVPQLYVVTGHLREQFQPVFPKLQAKYGIAVAEIFNPDFVEGSALSMAASLPVLEAARDGVLIMDGDVLYDTRMLRRLLDAPGRTKLLVDRNYSTADDDPVLVPMKNGKPFDFVKKWQGQADAIGESIGLFRVDDAELPLLISETKARLTGSGRKDSYDDILRAMVKAGVFSAVDVTGLPWTEVDFPGDLDYANQVILPALQDGA